MLKSTPQLSSLPPSPPPSDTRFGSRHVPGRYRGPRIYPNVQPVKKALYPRRTQLPPRLGVNTFLKKVIPTEVDRSEAAELIDLNRPADEEDEEEGTGRGPSWEPEEIGILSSLFEQRIFRSVHRKRAITSFSGPVPLRPPSPRRLERVGLPNPKKRGKTSLSLKNSYRHQEFLLGLAWNIGQLPGTEDVPVFLDNWAPFLRPGSLSLTIRELGHMGCPERALKVFTWAKTQPHLSPDDLVLASTVEVLASSGYSLNLSPCSAGLTSSRDGDRRVLESMIKGLVKVGDPDGALALVKYARDEGMVLLPCVYTGLIMEFGKNPGNEGVVLVLLNELGGRDDLRLDHWDCLALITVCGRIRRPDLAERLFEWYRRVGPGPPGVSMYTAIMQSRYHEKKYREALALLWEMEGDGRIFDLPLYGVVIAIYVALGDTAGMARYFKELKHAGFSPNIGIYRSVVKGYASSGRVSKCRDICMEVEAAGFDLRSLLREIESTSPGLMADIISIFPQDFSIHPGWSSDSEEYSSGDVSGHG